MFENTNCVDEAKIKDRKRDAFEAVKKGGNVLKAQIIVIVLTTLVIDPPDLCGESHEVVLTSDVEWEQLNPARGDKSPQAGTLWGDRKGTVPTGFLARFVDGFSSPPHIHNVTYRAVVISGSIHNDDPDAAEMWMPVGSFWTQPKAKCTLPLPKVPPM